MSSAAEQFVGKAIAVSDASQKERDLQGACHELLEIIEGQEYIIEDAQFALSYGEHIQAPGSLTSEIQGMIQQMKDVQDIAQRLYANAFNCKRARERAGFEVER